MSGLESMYERQMRGVAIIIESLQRHLYKTRTEIQNVTLNKTTGSAENIKL